MRGAVRLDRAVFVKHRDLKYWNIPRGNGIRALRSGIDAICTHVFPEGSFSAADRKNAVRPRGEHAVSPGREAFLSEEVEL